MLARDIKPSRLERAKQLLLRLTDKLENDRIGLILFAGLRIETRDLHRRFDGCRLPPSEKLSRLQIESARAGFVKCGFDLFAIVIKPKPASSTA